MSRSKRAHARTLAELAAAKEIIICCGSGGVGKTTVAASIGAMAAIEYQLKVLVVTVDPAKRLANALGLERFGNVETEVPAEAFRTAGVEPAGRLFAAMLDTKQSWDDLIHAHAPTPAVRDEILANPLYRNISGRFVQSHDYVAMERIYELHSSGAYDLIVVDTPPTRNAVDFLDAPTRMADFFSSRLLRWLIAPYRSRVLSMASKPFYSIADRVLGTQFLSDIAEFFILFQTMYDGFVERSEAVSRILAGDTTSFVVVSTLEPSPAQEARFFIEELRHRSFDVGVLVQNKALPAWLSDPAASETAKALAAAPEAVAQELDSIARIDTGDGLTASVLREIASNFSRWEVMARRESEQARVLAEGAGTVLPVPLMTDDICDLSGLVQIGRHLW